jgi:hypothetical protein
MEFTEAKSIHLNNSILRFLLTSLTHYQKALIYFFLLSPLTSLFLRSSFLLPLSSVAPVL